MKEKKNKKTKQIKRINTIFFRSDKPIIVKINFANKKPNKDFQVYIDLDHLNFLEIGSTVGIISERRYKYFKYVSLLETKTEYLVELEEWLATPRVVNYLITDND